ncbi:transcriptional regulator [Streptacidiphilus sp. EB103A]|uniref:transcriptional regulator n=1 Tax=Streptacidiphilus sp. EB103A TaxID=3156275 RepID=UPI0035144DD2
MAATPIRNPLAALRAELDLSGEEYLDRLDNSHHALGYGRMAKRREKVSRWETGVHAPDEPTRYAMAHLHGIPPAAVTELGWPGFLLLAFPRDRPVLDSPWSPAGTVAAVAAAARGGSMDRRGFLISSGAALSSIASHWSNAVTAAPLPLAAPGRRLDPDLMTRLERRLDDLRHLDDVLSGSDLLPSAVEEYRLLSGYASNTTCDSTISRRVFTALAEASRMCGWLHFDADQHAQAQRFYITSLRASASAGDAEVGANTLNFMAIQTYSKGNPQDAVNLVRTAQSRVAGMTTPRVRALLHARAGRALSKTGDLKGCAREFNAARDAFSRGTHDDDPPWAYSITEGEIEMLAGSSALDLGDPRRALHSFAAAQQAEYSAAGHVRDGLLYLTRTARAHLELGDVDAACATAAEALQQNSIVNSVRPSDALTDLRDQMAPHREVRAVREFLKMSA